MTLKAVDWNSKQHVGIYRSKKLVPKWQEQPSGIRKSGHLSQDCAVFEILGRPRKDLLFCHLIKYQAVTSLGQR